MVITSLRTIGILLRVVLVILMIMGGQETIQGSGEMGLMAIVPFFGKALVQELMQMGAGTLPYLI